MKTEINHGAPAASTPEADLPVIPAELAGPRPVFLPPATSPAASTAPAPGIRRADPRTGMGLGRGIPFNGVQIQRATDPMDPEHARALRWLYAHGRDKGWSLPTLASKLRKPGGKGFYDGNTLYRVFQGGYGGGLENIVESVVAYRRIAEARELAGRPPFIETALSNTIFRICDSAVTYQRMALVFGDGQTGKSEALEEYARRNNHGRTRYVRLPHGARYAASVRLIARSCYVGYREAIDVLTMSIIESADAQTLFIIDELQQIVLNPKEAMRLMFIEFLKELFDRAKCGIVLCGTNEALTELETGPNAVWLRQIRRRALPIIRLPAEPTDEDVLAFAGHYHLGPDMDDRSVEVVRQIASEQGIGQLITYFQATRNMADAEGQPISWGHFLRTVKALHEQGYVSGTPISAVNAVNGAKVAVKNGNGKGGR